MSGIGEIGLALGIYRFIISGVDDYRRAARTWRRYRDYDKEVERVMTILQTECEIFRNNFKLLLRRVPDSEEEWLSPEVERKLRMKLTTSYFPFRQTSQELNQCLKSLREKLNLNTDVSWNAAGRWRSYVEHGDHTKSRVFKEHYEKLLFAIRSDAYKVLIQEIRGHTERLNNLLLQCESISKQLFKIPRWAKLREVRDCVIRIAAAIRQRFCCGCKDKHRVFLRLDNMVPAVEDCSDEIAVLDNIVFRMGFEYEADNHSLSRPWGWKQLKFDPLPFDNPPSRIRNISFPSSTRQRYNTGVPVVPDLCETMQALLSPIPSLTKLDGPVGTFGCLEVDGLGSYLLAQREHDETDGLFSYPVSLNSWFARDNAWTRKAKCRFALRIASSLLYLHSTDWLKNGWDSQKVFLVQGQNRRLLFEPFVIHSTSTTIGWDIEYFQTAAPGLGSFKPILYELGLLLLEIAFQKPWQQLSSLDQGATQRDILLNNYVKAEELCKRIEKESGQLGPLYAEAAWNCIHGDFNERCKKFEDEDFLTEFYKVVVCYLISAEESYEMEAEE